MRLLPSHTQILKACVGNLEDTHPILQAAYELASLHEAVRDSFLGESDCIGRQRAQLVHDIDCWVARTTPAAHGGAQMHTETVGSVVDRLAHFSVLALETLATDIPAQERHIAWQRLSELSIGYSDMIFDVAAGVRRLPANLP
ncbi:DUF4254 domain-containing protein [Nocardia terpenica]|uniref:DUF4254 domain-containing protein n=1 Tax=Nocardia terpenica TaxID=455432 RepID=A0A291RXY8_9NOCA|nr:DUF4254 domain-containing protein [Nocardia terpenica]ATL72122.1 hypothetical protein CRH09_26345 [Nocardia terpenica]